MSSAVPLDTEQAVYDRQVEVWKAMTIADRVELISQMHADVEAIARAGIARSRPGLTEVEVLRELARRRYGSDLADAAFGPEPDR